MQAKSDKTEVSAQGMLNERKAFEHFDLRQIPAPKELADFVSGFWSVQWDLPDGKIFQHANLPHPVQHVVLDPQRGSGLFGCTQGRFDYEIQGKGRVLGARLHPGALCSLYARSARNLTDSSVLLEEVLCVNIKELEDLLWLDSAPVQAVSALKEIIKAHAKPLPKSAQKARLMIEYIIGEKQVVKVKSLAETFDMDVRALQRLFEKYVGVTPKWIIDRYRMFEALDALNRQEIVDLSDLALQLDYTDQAHFSTQFKKLTGVSPGRYLKAQSPD